MSPQSVPARSHNQSRALMLASTACFIVNVLLIRALNDFAHLDMWLITSARFVVGLVVVSTLYRREFQPRNLVTHRKLIERGILGAVCTLGFYFTVSRLGAGRATFINNTYIIWGGLMAVWALKEKLRPALVISAVVTLVGLSLLTATFSSTSTSGAYDALALLIALGAGWILVTIRQLHQREHTSTIFASQCAYGLLLCGVPALAHIDTITPIAAALLVLAGLCASAGQLLMTTAFRDLSVAEGALIQMLVPLGISLGGVLLFGEHFTTIELIGAGLILIGISTPRLVLEQLKKF